jgi:hypothetical protein
VERRARLIEGLDVPGLPGHKRGLQGAEATIVIPAGAEHLLHGALEGLELDPRVAVDGAAREGDLGPHPPDLGLGRPSRSAKRRFTTPGQGADPTRRLGDQAV